MPSKYDTNPLDPAFPEKARAKAADGSDTARIQDGAVDTTILERPSVTEEQTLRFAEHERMQYSSPSVPFYEAGSMMSGFSHTKKPLTRKIESVGLPENILIAAPYVPWYIGMVFGLLILFFVPKSEAKVRFHAAQGLAAHVGILIVTTILGMVANVTDLANIGNVIFQAFTSVMLIIFAVKAWQGKPVHIESVDSLTNWLEDAIKPGLKK
jgi:uncharacterized membrane protein